MKITQTKWSFQLINWFKIRSLQSNSNQPCLQQPNWNQMHHIRDRKVIMKCFFREKGTHLKVKRERLLKLNKIIKQILIHQLKMSK